MQEIVGRAAPGQSENLSITRFRLEPGATTGSSRYQGADEHFYILSGHGVAEIEDRRTPIGPGDVVRVRRGAPHALTADAPAALEFLALIAPAFNPAHYAPEAAPN
ncbi:MAG: cupin domain-containing protein [Verrucomicrobia bacterium]|nr:cupin domain-containing protein [Verrucomicrobiota bacterium]